MHLPNELEQLLTGYIAALLNEQWGSLLLQQKIIRAAKVQLGNMRSTLRHDDRETASTASLTSLSIVSRTSSGCENSPEDSIHLAFPEASIPIPNDTLCPLPSGYQMEQCFFIWSAPPTHWLQADHRLFSKIQGSPTLRKLWRLTLLQTLMTHGMI